MALKDLKSDLGKFRTVIKPDGTPPDPPKSLEFGKYTPVSDMASSYNNAKKFSTRSILSFERPKTDLIDETDLVKFESEYDNDSIKKYNLASRLQNEGITIKNKPAISGNNEKTNITTERVNTSGNNEESSVKINNVKISGNNEISPINITPIKISGNNEKSQIQISNVETQGNNEVSNINPISMDLTSRQLSDNSSLNIDQILKSIPFGRHETDTSNLNIDDKIGRYEISSRVIKLDSNFNIDGTPNITMAGGRYEKPKKTIYGFLNNAPSVNFFSNTFFTGFNQRQTETAYTGETSIYSWKGDRKRAPATNFFSNTNVKSGFDTFAKLGDSKYLFNSAYGGIGAVDFFKNVNVSDGFTLNAKLYESKFLNNSIYGTLKNLNAFSDQFASGFTPKFKLTQFTDEAFDYGFKGKTPSVDFFANTNVTQGFHRFAKLGDTKYITDSSVFTWKGGGKSAPATNFFIDTHATGFTKFQNTTAYATDSSIHTWKGGSANAPETNFFLNTNTISGFTKFAFGQPTQFKIDSSKYTWVGGRADAPAVDFFLNTNGDGFKTFNKLYESHYKTDSTILHEIATTPAELARTGGGTYKLNNQLIKSPLFNNVGFSKQTGTYTDVLKSREFNSILGETANKRNSDSLLDTQYNKYDLTNDSFNPDFIKQPYILRGIQKPGSVENERWGTSIAIADGLIRGGAMTALNRTIEDVKRVTKFMISAKGINFITKQVGLHLSTQNQETDPTGAALNLGFNPVKIYNPIAQLLSVAGSSLGLHFTRHGLIPILSNNRYESAVRYRNDNDTETFDTIRRNIFSALTPFAGYQNRLLQLSKELLSPQLDGWQLTGKAGDTKLVTYSSQANRGRDYSTYYNTFNIDRLTYLTGPSSLYGIGLTIVNRATNTIPADAFKLNSAYNMYFSGKAHKHSKAITKSIRTGSNPLISNIGFLNYQMDLLYYDALSTSIQRSKDNKRYVHLKDRLGERSEYRYDGYKHIKLPFTRGLIDFDRLDDHLGFTPLNYHALAASVTENSARVFGAKERLKKSYATMDQLIFADNTVNANLPRRKFVENYKIKDFRYVVGALDNKTNPDVTIINDYPIQKAGNNQALRALFTNPKIIDFDQNNLEDRFGFGNQGKVGLYRDNPTRTHRGSIGADGNFEKNTKRFIGDRVQLIDFKNQINTENIRRLYELEPDPLNPDKYGFDGAEDLIEFYVTGPQIKDRAIVFRATINDIQDNFSPSYNSIKYLGRADPIYLYSSFERSVSISFQIAVTSRDELRSRWRSINALAAYTAPEYLKTGRMRAPLMKLTLGHLFRQTPVFINSLNYSFDNSQITWETAKLKYDGIGYDYGDEEAQLDNTDGIKDPSKHGVLQLPKFINVKMDLKIIGNYRPQLNGDPADKDGKSSPDMGIMYNLYETEDGTLPRTGPGNGVRINYFSDVVRVNTSKPANPTTGPTPAATQDNRQPVQTQVSTVENSTSTVVVGPPTAANSANFDKSDKKAPGVGPSSTSFIGPPPARTDAGTSANQANEFPKFRSSTPNAAILGRFAMSEVLSGKPILPGYSFVMSKTSNSVVLASDELIIQHPEYFVCYSPPDDKTPIPAFTGGGDTAEAFAKQSPNFKAEIWTLIL